MSACSIGIFARSGGLPDAKVDELLVAEVLDDLDAGREGSAVAARVPDLDVLGPEADEHAVLAEPLDHVPPRRRSSKGADEAADEDVGRARVQLLGVPTCWRTPSRITAMRSPIVIAST